MTPDRRLDQLEPLMADSLQKIARLIEGQGQLAEGQGQILDVATRADQKADITAKGVAELTISTQRQFKELKTGQEQLIINQGGLKAGQEELNLNYQELKVGQEELNLNYQELRGNQEELRKNQESLKAGQEAIMNYLREKLP